MSRLRSLANGVGLAENRRSLITAASALVLAVLATLFALKAAQPIMLPIAFAFVISLLFRPVAAFLDRAGAPQGVSAGVISAFFVIAVLAGAYFGGRPAVEWLEDLPNVLDEAKDKVKGVEKAWRRVQEVGASVAELGVAPNAGAAKPIAVREQSMAASIGELAQSFLVQFTLVAVLLYLFLATRRSSLRKALALRKTFKDRLQSARILLRIERNVMAYLLTMVAINTGLAIAVAVGLSLVGAPTPIMFGVLAGALNFVPYLGPTLLNIALLATGFVQGDNILSALAPFGVYLTLNFVESNFVTPFLVGTRSEVSPLAIILAISLFVWLWGPAGAVVAIPLLVVVKTVCDSVGPLKTMSILLSDDVRSKRRAA